MIARPSGSGPRRRHFMPPVKSWPSAASTTACSAALSRVRPSSGTSGRVQSRPAGPGTAAAARSTSISLIAPISVAIDTAGDRRNSARVPEHACPSALGQPTAGTSESAHFPISNATRAAGRRGTAAGPAGAGVAQQASRRLESRLEGRAIADGGADGRRQGSENGKVLSKCRHSSRARRWLAPRN
jgi:hypothetical protein